MLTFNDERHEYRLEGVRLPSVTQIMKPLMDFSGIPPNVLERKRQIGTAFHKAVELHLNDDLVLESLAVSVVPYFEGFIRFMNDTGFQPRKWEYRVASSIYGYAGQLDIDGYLRKRLAVIDFKTTHEISPSVAIQTAAYRQAANETNASEETIVDRYALQLRPDGTYRLEQHKGTMDFEIFKSLLNIHKWKAANNV